MARKRYYTKAEKRSWWNGVRFGRMHKKKAYRKKRYSSPKPGAYNSRGRVNENRVDDLHGPVVFWDDFDYDRKGRIKGSYTADGFFEPD